MLNTLLKTPKGIEELTTFLGLSGFLLFLLSKRVKPGLKWTAVCLLLFLIVWRMVFSRFHVMSSRYVSGLIIPFLLFAVYLFYKFQKTKSKTNKWIATILVAVLLANYIMNDVKHNRHDANYYAIAEIAQKSEKRGERKEFLIEEKEFERLSYLCKTDNTNKKRESHLQYIDNFGHSYYPEIVDVDSNSIITLQGQQKRIGSFLQSRSSKKRINLIASPPEVFVTANPILTSRDNKNNLLQNGSIEELESSNQSHRNLVNSVFDYSLYYEYDESARIPKKAYFKAESGTDKKTILGIESESPINGCHSISFKVNYGDSRLVFDQTFHNGQYQYSFLIKGKKGTLIQPYYTTYSNRIWKTTPICLFTIPDSQTYLLSTAFDIDGLNEKEFFVIGVRFQNGEALLDDFVLTGKDND